MIRLAQVVAVNPGKRKVELVMLANGARYADVDVMTGVAGSDVGVWAVPNVPRPRAESSAGGEQATGRTVMAVCAMNGSRPIVLGFIQPLGGFATSEQDRAIYRHPSGAVVTVAPNGDIEATTGELRWTLRPAEGRVEVVGNIEVTGGITATEDIVAGTVSLQEHVHGGVDPGGGSSGPPEA